MAPHICIKIKRNASTVFSKLQTVSVIRCKKPYTIFRMKTVFAILAFCLVGALASITDEQRAKLVEYKTSCIIETGVDAAVVQNAKEGKIAEDDEKLACFFACFLKKIGIMNADGTINEEVARAKIPASVPKDKADEVINKCKVLKGATECETAKKVMKCYGETKTFSILD